ncbi:esterase family protein [Shewanella corallii]|uniref:Esterase family protein n=1 Tax=Shewanella corallii TaxID=560080 RepID=A0ABT0NCV0_9GAMM|nr:alpha/beta hydrolase-fold protein [Shewanella corallii]MCL2915920.1 esterase family protein [Shewanella corallii]
MRAITKVATGVAILLCAMQAWAEKAPQVSAGQLEQLQGVSFKSVQPRTLEVWLPDNVAGKKLAVLYMHDGQMLFDAKTTWNGQEWRVDEVAQQLIDSGTTIPFMVVGVHNAGEHRRAEYFPQQAFEDLSKSGQEAFYQFQQTSGVPVRQPYSDNYLKFLVEELKPYIDRHYPVHTGPEYTFLMGSSMGGLISMYGLTQYPEVFGGAACLSTHWPGIHDLNNNPIPEAFRDYLEHKLPEANSRKLYFDYGDQTLDALYPPLQQAVDKVMVAQGWSSPQWQTRFFPGTNHSENAWADRLAIPLTFLLGRAELQEEE